MILSKRSSATLVLLAALACNGDHAVEPDALPYVPNAELVGLPEFSTTLGIDNVYNPTNSVTLSTYPRPTLVFLSISGLTTATYLPNQLEQTFDARGRWAGGGYEACYEGVAISFGTSGAIDFGTCGGEGWYPSPVDPLTKYIVVQGQGSAWWTGGRPHASNECGINAPCRTYEGDKQIVVEPVWVDYTATAAPTSINFRDTVTVTVTVTPSQVGGVSVPFSIDSTKWVPAFGTQTNPCQVANFVVVDPQTLRCRKEFTRSGTFSLFAAVNGTNQQKTFEITVVPPQFDVTASPETMQGPDSVTFTASVTPPSITWNLSNWTWRPDVGTGGISATCSWTDKVCKRLISRSGWMKGSATIGEYSVVDSVHVTVNPPEFDVTAAPATVQGPDSIIFTASVNPSSITWTLSNWTWRPDVGSGGLTPGCSSTDKTCKRLVTRSGWMKASTTIGQYTLVDSVHVTVNPPVFDVTATPASIPGAQSVTFNATLTPPPPITWNLSSWIWRPDVGTGGLSASCSWEEKTCTRTVSKSGWMKATVTIGAHTLVDSARVFLGSRPPLTLTADRTTITAGETVTFTTAAGGEPYSIASWVYRVGSTSQSVSCGTATQCVTPLSQSGTMWVYGTVLDQPDSASVAITVQPEQVSISITVTTFTAPHSFTAKTDERRINLQATVTPASYASQVEWLVQTIPSHLQQSPLPGSLTGANAFFDVTALSTTRWPASHTQFLMPVEPNKIAYRIKATVRDAGGQLHESNTVDAVQDEIDTMREEYVEFNMAVPSRSQFTVQSRLDPGLNTGDYGYMAWNAPFVDALNTLSSTWASQGQWQINSQFRNPVHQQKHLSAIASSLHQYGCAADLQTFPTPRNTPEDTEAATDFWNDLHDLADSQGFDVEPMAQSGVGHVHVEKIC